MKATCCLQSKLATQPHHARPPQADPQHIQLGGTAGSGGTQCWCTVPAGHLHQAPGVRSGAVPCTLQRAREARAGWLQQLVLSAAALTRSMHLLRVMDSGTDRQEQLQPRILVLVACSIHSCTCSRSMHQQLHYNGLKQLHDYHCQKACMLDHNWQRECIWYPLNSPQPASPSEPSNARFLRHGCPAGMPRAAAAAAAGWKVSAAQVINAQGREG